MDRDTQIQLLAGAKERVQKTLADWLKDERVKSALRQNHQNLRHPHTPPLKRACG